MVSDGWVVQQLPVDVPLHAARIYLFPNRAKPRVATITIVIYIWQYRRLRGTVGGRRLMLMKLKHQWPILKS